MNTPAIDLDLFKVFAPYRKQAEFLTATARNRYFVGGRGAGKSWTLTLDALMQALLNPGVPGALLGRTERDLRSNLLPFLRAHLDTLQRATGFNWIRRYSNADQSIELQNGATIWWRGYERIDKLRGHNLAWCCADEICWSETTDVTVFETITSAIRVPCRRPGFSVASSPNGLRGITKLFHLRTTGGDPNYWITRATSYDNPYLEPHVIEAWRSAMSDRRWRQECLAIALRPSSVVFSEFSETRHVVPWNVERHRNTCRWVFGIDWGLNRAVAVAFQVLQDGRWILVDELVDRPESRGHWRTNLRRWIDQTTRNQAPYLLAPDRACPEENRFLHSVYGVRKTRVVPLSSKYEQYVRNGLAAMQDMLAPVEGAPRLLFSDKLPRQYDGDLQGILPSLLNYRYKLDRDGVPTDRPSKDNVHDHAIDAARMAIVAGLRWPDLHAGMLPNRITRGPDGVFANQREGTYSRAHF